MLLLVMELTQLLIQTTITYSVGAQGEGLLVGGTDNGPATVRLPFDETSDLSALTNRS